MSSGKSPAAPILGAHMSISGGYFRAVEIARECGCECVQLFTKNNNQWRAKPITADDERLFQAALARLNIGHPISHASYLINLASPDPALWRKSVDAMVVELRRAEQLGIPFVVVHPGSHTTASADEGLAGVACALDDIHEQTADLTARCLLENTAGQGSNLGWQFEQLAAILNRVAQPDRVGVCFDTCHAFAAGYPLAERRDFLATFRDFDKLIGLDRIQAFHLNDSKREFGSRVDRHEHIGAGQLGLPPFQHLLNDKRFRRVPMYLETPKGLHDGEEWDVTNLRTLRGLIE